MPSADLQTPNQAMDQTSDSVLRRGESVGCEALTFFVLRQLPSPAPIERGKKSNAGLWRAKGALPPAADADNAIHGCHEYLDHNELERACDMLEAHAEEHPVSGESWVALRDASVNMQPHVRAADTTALRLLDSPTLHRTGVTTAFVGRALVAIPVR